MRFKFKQPYVIKRTPTIPSKMFFATISAEILLTCGAISFVVQFIKTCKAFLERTLRQGVDPFGVKNILIKMINRQVLKFENFNLIQQLLTSLVDMYICLSIHI